MRKISKIGWDIVLEKLNDLQNGNCHFFETTHTKKIETERRSDIWRNERNGRFLPEKISKNYRILISKRERLPEQEQPFFGTTYPLNANVNGLSLFSS